MSPLDMLSEPVWQRLTWTLLHFLWQGVAVAAAAATLVAVWPVRRPDHRYAIYVAALVVMAVCPVVMFLVIDIPDGTGATGFQRVAAAEGPRDPEPGAEVETGQTRAESPSLAHSGTDLWTLPPHPGDLETRPPLEHPETAMSPSASPGDSVLPGAEDIDVVAGPTGWKATLRQYVDSIQPYFAIAWMAGVMMLAARLWISWLRVRWLARDRRAIPRILAAKAAAIGSRLGLKRRLRVCISERVRTAIVVGLWRPLVLLPASWLAEMTPEVLEAVLAHELAHVRRWDLWVNLLQRLVETVLFYHPAVWWLSRRLSVEREMCADELAVAATGERLAYATALEQLGRQRVGRAAPQMATPIGGKKMILLRRVSHVLGLSASHHRARWWPVGLLGLAVPLVIWLAAAGMAAPEKGDPRPEVAGQPAADETAGVDAVAAPAKTGQGPHEVGKAIANSTTVVGKVVDRQGKPVEGAKVAIATAQADVSISGTELQGRVITTTDAGGRFSLPRRDESVALAAAHPRGYAELALKEFPADGMVKLQPWGRLEGEVLFGDKRGAGVSVGGGYCTDAIPVQHSVSATTDAEAKFVVERIAPPEACISIWKKTGEGSTGVWGTEAWIEIKPGETTRLTLGGKGRPVVGRLKAWRDLDWPKVRVSMRLSAPPAMLLTEEHGPWEVWAQFLRSEYGKPYNRDNIPVDPDGSIRIENVPQGRYQLFVRVPYGALGEEAWGDSIATQASTEFTIAPMPGGSSDEPLDIGTLAIRPPEHSGDAAQHISLLERSLGSMEVTIHLEPKEGAPDFKLRTVTLSVPPVPREPGAVWPDGTPREAAARISIDSANKAVKMLGKLGFFEMAQRYHSERRPDAAKAAEPPAGSEPYAPPSRKDSHWRIELKAGDEDWWTHVVVSHGWDMNPVPFFDVIRSALEGNAAEAVDRLLAQLDRERKQWEEGSGTPWDDSFDGVQARLRAETTRWTVGEAPVLKADVRNRGKRELFVAAVQPFCEVEVDGQWYRSRWYSMSSRFGPGWEHKDMAITLDAKHWQPKAGGKLLTLAPGQHTVRVAFIGQPAAGDKGGPVRAVTNPVEIEVVPAGSAWADPVEGVQVRLAAEKGRWLAGEVPVLEAGVRNTGTRDLDLGHTYFQAEVEVDGRRYQWTGPADFTTPDPPYPRQYEDIPIYLYSSSGWTAPGDLQQTLRLKPGKHVVRVALYGDSHGRDGGRRVRAVSNPVEITVAKPAPGEEDVAWGPTVRGLQAGIRCLGQPPQVRVGEGLDFQCVVRNVSAQPIRFTTFRPPFLAPVLRDARGRRVEVTTPTKYAGPVEIVDVRLEPGRSFTLNLLPCLFLPRQPIYGTGHFEARAATTPGKYHALCQLDLKKVNDGDWEGRLETGQVDLKVLEPDRDALTGKVASALKDRINAFTLKVVYLGDDKDRFRSLRLMTDGLDETFPPHWTTVRIEKKQAAAVIDHLAQAGLLWRTVAEPYKPSPKPSYFLTMTIGDTLGAEDPARRFRECIVPLGWGPEMLKHLDALRKVLDGDAAKAMGQLLAQLEPLRKQWEDEDDADPATAQRALEAFLPQSMAVTGAEVTPLGTGWGVLLHASPKDRSKAHPSLAVFLWPKVNDGACPYDDKFGSHTFVRLGASEKYTVYYSGPEGPPQAAVTSAFLTDRGPRFTREPFTVPLGGGREIVIHPNVEKLTEVGPFALPDMAFFVRRCRERLPQVKDGNYGEAVIAELRERPVDEPPLPPIQWKLKDLATFEVRNVSTEETIIQPKT